MPVCTTHQMRNPQLTLLSVQGKRGMSSPRPSRDTQDSAEDSVEEITEQPQGAVANNVENNVDRNKNSPPGESESCDKESTKFETCN